MKCSLTTQEKLRDLRAKLGYKLQQVEIESRISSSTISNYENDTSVNMAEDEALTMVDKATVLQWSKKFDLNFTKLTPEETRSLLQMITKASRNPLIKQPSKGRGKKK